MRASAQKPLPEGSRPFHRGIYIIFIHFAQGLLRLRLCCPHFRQFGPAFGQFLTMQTLPMNSGTMMRRNSPVASSRASISMPSMNCRHSRPCAQLTSFSGFRRANEVDSAGSHSGHASLKAVVSRSNQQSRRGSGHKVTRMMFERFTEKARHVQCRCTLHILILFCIVQLYNNSGTLYDLTSLCHLVLCPPRMV